MTGLPSHVPTALYQQKWGADTEDLEERLFLGALLRTTGAKLVEGLRTVQTDDKLFNERCHDLARTLDEGMAELQRWGDL